MQPKVAVVEGGRAPPSLARSEMHRERSWLVVMAVIVAAEFCWWGIAWSRGIAPAPHVGTYAVVAGAGLITAATLRLALGMGPSSAGWATPIVATLLTAFGASIFLPLKYAIPHEIPFWLDRPLALGERSLFGLDPWLALDRLFGWAAIPIDWIYGAWLPTQLLVLFLLILAQPSAAKSRALIAYSTCWFLLGVVAALLFASAGPIFYDRLLGGQAFAPLAETLHRRGVWIAIAESDGMWASFASQQPGPVAGISAVPSIHVAISLWMALAARALAPRLLLPALAYFAIIWIGSVQLGWHYVADGLAGAVGMLAIWWLSERLRVAIPVRAPIFQQPR